MSPQMSNFKNIIFVDDDEDDRMVFRDMIQELYPEVLYNEFSSAEEVLSYLDCDYILCPDLVFLDINMPLKDGFHVLRNIKKKERLKNIPVVIFSTSKNPADMEKAKKLGAVGFAVKPSEISTFTEVIKTAADKILFAASPAKNLIMM
jgi:CheY-like chemotaxis protein